MTGAQEQTWATRAVGDGALAWDIEGVTRVRVATGDRDPTPYR